jgi:hypothetical protein
VFFHDYSEHAVFVIEAIMKPEALHLNFMKSALWITAKQVFTAVASVTAFFRIQISYRTVLFSEG